jgi:signal transduction histidine kinase
VGLGPGPRRAEADLIADIARGQPKALACYFLFLFPSSTKADDLAVHDAMIRTRTYVSLPRRAPTGPNGVKLSGPIPLVASAVKGMGYSDQQADEDGIVRRVALDPAEGNGRIGRLVTQMAAIEGHAPDATVRRLMAEGGMLIPYVGRAGSFETIPAISVLEGRVSPSVFHNKFVLLGATAPDLLDNYPTPTASAAGMSSVEVDANILDSLLSGQTIWYAPRGTSIVLSLGLLWIVLVALVRLGPRDNLWLAATMTGAPLIGSLVGVVFLSAWIPPVPYLLTLAIVLPYWGWRRLNAASAYFAEELRVLEAQSGGGVLARSRSTAVADGDVVLQQMTLIEDTRRRISDLRRFVDDILANFPDPVLVIDTGGRILTVNQAATELAQRIGQSALPDAPVQPILLGVAGSGNEARAMWPPPDPSEPRGKAIGAQPIADADPSGRTYELRFTPTRNADDEPTGWIVHLADITSLVSAMRQREEALQLLSHDMRSPLSAILATLDHSDFSGTPAGLRQRIESQAIRTLDLADAFVRLAKAESADYAFEPIDLGHLLHDAADFVWPLANARGVRVDLHTDDEEYVVLAERGLLTRALVNLLDNAVKFSPAGASVACRLTPVKLTDRLAVACEIADEAGGMSPAELAVLFHRFASSREAPNTSGGVGLGLALVHTVVTRHDGVITCNSVEGEGAVFTITLPLHDEMATPSPGRVAA